MAIEALQNAGTIVLDFLLGGNLNPMEHEPIDDRKKGEWLFLQSAS